MWETLARASLAADRRASPADLSVSGDFLHFERPNSAFCAGCGPADAAEMEIEWRSAVFVDESPREFPAVFYTILQGIKSLVLNRPEPDWHLQSVGWPWDTRRPGLQISAPSL